jgi:hypothetical protein
MRRICSQFRAPPVDPAATEIAAAVADYDRIRASCGLLPLERSPGGRTAARMLRQAARRERRRQGEAGEE